MEKKLHFYVTNNRLLQRLSKQPARRTLKETRDARWHASIPKSQFGYILEDLGMENVGISYGHLDYIFYDEFS
jgi:hypothetical protein